MLKKVYFLFFVCLYFHSYGQLSGYKTIGGLNPDFNTIQEAINSLNQQGINGNVVFNIRNGVYNENLKISPVNGVNSIHSVTFQSEGLSALDVTIAGDSISVVENLSNYIKFKYLTFTSTDSQTNALISLVDVNNVTIDGCVFTQQIGSNYGIQTQANNLPFHHATILNSSFLTDVGVRVDGKYIHDLNVSGNNFEVDNMAIYMHGDSLISVVSLNGNVISNSDVGINFDVTTNSINNVTISNGSIKAKITGIKVSSDNDINNFTIDHVVCKGEYPLLTGNNSDGINIQAYNSFKNLTIKNSTIDSVESSGIYVFSDNISNNHNFSNNNVIGNTNGISINGNNQLLQNINFSHNFIKAVSDVASLISGNNGIQGVTFIGDSLISKHGGLSIIANNNKIQDVSIDSTYLSTVSNSVCCEVALNIDIQEGVVDGIQIDNSKLYGYYGIKSFSKLGISNFVLSNDSIQSNFNSLSIENNYNSISDLSILNSNLETEFGISVVINSSNSTIDSITINNSKITGDNGIDITSFLGASNISIDSSIIVGQSNIGLNYNGQYGGFSNFNLSNSNVSGFDHGIFINQDAQNISSCELHNNVISCSEYCSNGYGLYLYTEYSGILNLHIDSNTIIGTNYSINIKGNGTGLKNSTFQNNLIELTGAFNNGTGMYIEKMCDNFKLTNNRIKGLNPNTGYAYGAYFDGTNQTVNNILIQGNTIENPSQSAFDIENISGTLEFSKNKVTNDLEYESMEALYLYNIDSLLLFSNQIYAKDEYYAIDIEAINYSKVYNNFISGFLKALNCNSCKNILFTHNTWNSIKGNYSDDFISFANNSSNNQFINNLINVDSVSFSGNVFSLESGNELGICLSNVYNVDTLSSNLIFISNSGDNFKSIFDWKNYSNKENLSFYHSALFENDTNDLHLKCSEIALNNGSSLVNLTTDIDGNIRNTIPTIGADEVLHAIDLILEDTITTCNLPIVVGLNGDINGDIIWSTQSVNTTTNVNTYGYVVVQVDNGCSILFDSVYVVHCDDANLNSFNFGRNNWSVYPNPTNSNITLSNEENVFINSIIIYDIAGTIVSKHNLEKELNKLELDLFSLKSGMYNLEIKENQNTKFLKIIKE